MNNRKKNPPFGSLHQPIIFNRKSPAEVIFGAPGQGCNGYGVCLITSRPTLGRYACPATPCQIAFDLRMEVILLEVNHTDLSPEVYDRFFAGRTHFLVEESYPLPLLVLKGHAQGKRYGISSGNFPILLSGHTLTIRMPIHEIWTGRRAGNGVITSLSRAVHAEIFRSFYNLMHREYSKWSADFSVGFGLSTILKKEILTIKI